MCCAYQQEVRYTTAFVDALMFQVSMLLCALQNENDPTILSEWQHVVPVEEFFDIISEVHCREKVILDQKRLTEARMINKISFGVK